jgi:hypothetical protein
MNRLNYKIYKKRFLRFGKRLGVIPVIEGNYKTHLHTHLTIELPTHLELDSMKEMIVDCWSKTRLGHSNRNFGVVIKPIIDEGWLSYQLKMYSKDDLISSIDWINLSSSV